MPKSNSARAWHCIILACSVSATAQDLKLEVVYPREDLTIATRDSAFVFGNFSPASARVTINGFAAQHYPNNTFLVMVPVSPGRFTFHAVARLDSMAGADSIAVDRHVYIPPYLVTTPSAPFMIDTSYVFPRESLEMVAGDLLGVAIKGSSGGRATFSIAGLAEDLPMAEQPARKNFSLSEAVFGRVRPPRTSEVQGIYTGAYLITANDAIQDAAINFQLVSAGGDTIRMVAPGRLTVRSFMVPQVARLTAELTVGRTGPGKGYQFFLPTGVKLMISGREGNYYRARLTDDESIWLPIANCELLPLGTLPPAGVVQVTRTESLPDRTRVILFLEERLPFKIEQITKPQGLKVSVYGATADTDWIRHDYGDPLVGEIRWAQEQLGKYRLSIDLNQKLQWGYRAFFEGNNLVIEVKKTPTLPGWPKRPLQDLLVCVDPGHNPELGAIGPTGFTEQEATALLALQVQHKLIERGARVILTRTEQHGITLAARTKVAEVSNADLFVSLHYNALPDGVNPFLNRGSSAYYFHPQSYDLAGKILKALLQKLKLPNFGLYYDNLAVCRITSMPAVLIEPAFIMHPLEEALILDVEFREKTAEAIVLGIEEFVKTAKD